MSDPNQTIDYGNLMHKAMRGLILEVVTDNSANGLASDHLIFSTFDTRHPDGESRDWL